MTVQAMLPYMNTIRGIDVSQGMVDKYNAGAREAGRSEAQMHAVRGDLLVPAAASGLNSQEFQSFDLVIMSMALHHVDNPQTMINRLVQRLKPGGTVVIVDWIPSGRASPPASAGRGQGGVSPQSQGAGTAAAAPGQQQHPGVHTISFDGFTKEQMASYFAKAGCRSSDYVLASSASAVPPDPSGQKRMFFAKGTK